MCFCLDPCASVLRTTDSTDDALGSSVTGTSASAGTSVFSLFSVSHTGETFVVHWLGKLPVNSPILECNFGVCHQSLFFCCNFVTIEGSHIRGSLILNIGFPVVHVCCLFLWQMHPCINCIISSMLKTKLYKFWYFLWMGIYNILYIHKIGIVSHLQPNLYSSRTFSLLHSNFLLILA